MKSGKSLIQQISCLKNIESIASSINCRIKQFRKLNKKSIGDWFSELCFCILTANSSAQLCIKCQKVIGKHGFINYTKSTLAKNLQKLGYRFYNKRSEYICTARKFLPLLKNQIIHLNSPTIAREWFVKTINGVGYKEASHFLRNIGYDNVAILDRHILKLMHDHKLVPTIKKSISKYDYIKFENILRKIAMELNISLAELDLYMWYMRTGKILK